MYQAQKNNMDILKALLDLSEKHLQHLLDENWDKDWDEFERMDSKKRKLCKGLLLFDGHVFDQNENEIICRIEQLEQKTKEELGKKRNIIKQELIRINKGSGALKGYKKTNETSARRGFGIIC